MDWQTKMNKALDYIEENLACEIKLENAARFMGCSVWEFQRLFSFVTHTSLGEYIRGRKLAQAANDIQTGDEKIIEIGIKYGYESPAAFARAFGRQYGVSPSSARKTGTTLTPYHKLTFQNTGDEGSKNMEAKSNLQIYGERGYYVKENEPIYVCLNMDETIGWFRDVLGWFGSVIARDENGAGVYGGVHDYPTELVVAHTFPIAGFQLSKGEPHRGLVGFIHVKGLDRLRQYVLRNGWRRITEIIAMPYGVSECHITTIDGCTIGFCE
ncbi:MAG: helix-turn-helix domain-containing protein [Defluviitaleaceae bacterium]|nr:helix-turn-helix domain-containing protein [Defluviitaleaceae bacterium]